MLLKILSVSLVTVVVSSVIKQYRSDISMLVNISGAALVIMLSIDGISQILDGMLQISQFASLSQTIISPLLKVVGIGYITEFGADVADDAGNKSMSSKIIFGGKIAICVVAIPIVVNMINAILSLL